MRIFADVGTYAEAWDKNVEGDRFLFDAGFQISIFKEVINKDPMKTKQPVVRSTRMSPDAYAGFLKLWLTSPRAADPNSADVDAYLSHANKREPLPVHLCHGSRHGTDKAA